jgi:hypothetical protein
VVGSVATPLRATAVAGSGQTDPFCHGGPPLVCGGGSGRLAASSGGLGKVKAFACLRADDGDALGTVYLLGGIILLPLSSPAPVSFLGENHYRVCRRQ